MQTLNDTQIANVLERLGEALSAGDMRGISSCWEVPSLVLSEDGAIAVAGKEEIENFFVKAKDWYHSRGLVSTRPEIERVDRFSANLASVDVRWPAFDASGKEKSSERSHYLMQVGKDGQPRIRVALTRTM